MKSNLPVSVLLSKIEDNTRKMTIIDSRMRALAEENSSLTDAIKNAIASQGESFGNPWKDLLFLWTKDPNFPALWFFERLQAEADECANDFLLIEKQEKVRVRFGGTCSSDDYSLRSSYFLLLLKSQPMVIDLQRKVFEFNFSLGGKIGSELSKITEKMTFSGEDVYSVLFISQDGKNKSEGLLCNSVSGYPLYRFVFGSPKILQTFVPDFDDLLKFLGIVVDKENGRLKTGTLSLF